MSYDSSNRKLEHIEISLREDVEGPLRTWFECVHLIHNAIPELDLNELDLSLTILGRRLTLPLIITGMTGGAPGTEVINAELAKVAESLGIGLGVGSQRAAVENESLRYTYSVVREYAPNSLILANIGISEFIRYDTSLMFKLVDMIDADALAIHLNVAQELTQPEGSHSFKGFVKKLEAVMKDLPVPIVIKEVGFGISKEVAEVLSGIGVRYFDVAGAGGTNWAKIEMFRARLKNDRIKERVASELLGWGIPTAASIIEVRNGAPTSTLIASGGIRTALDVIKALRLGADLVGMALPILKAYYSGKLIEYLKGLSNSIKALMLLSGSKNVAELRGKPVVIYDPLKSWITQRDLKVP
ncbi:MAG: type 2 isopentenyl-diphosphate Delta-isomerase [Sulfolobales archaeon]